jgi:hypothetical protein
MVENRNYAVVRRRWMSQRVRSSSRVFIGHEDFHSHQHSLLTSFLELCLTTRIELYLESSSSRALSLVVEMHLDVPYSDEFYMTASPGADMFTLTASRHVHI